MDDIIKFIYDDIGRLNKEIKYFNCMVLIQNWHVDDIKFIYHDIGRLNDHECTYSYMLMALGTPS